jgi:hypothetical protein
MEAGRSTLRTGGVLCRSSFIVRGFIRTLHAALAPQLPHRECNCQTR